MVRRDSQEECIVRRNGRPIWLLMFAALAALAIATPAVAQMGGIVKGTVVDDKGQPVENAKVTITMPDTGRKFETKTNKKGEYLQIGLGSRRLQGHRRERQARSAPVTNFGAREHATQEANLDARRREPRPPAKDAAEKNTALKKAFDAGVALSNEGKHDEAIAKFNEALAISPKCYDCYDNIGFSYVQKKDYDKAEEAYKKAIEIKPDDPGGYNGLANIYNAQRKFDLATQASAKATELSAPLSARRGGGNADALFNQGVILWNGGKIAEAKKSFEAAVAANPNMAEAHYQLGMALVNEGNMAGAGTEFDTYLRLSPAGPNAATAKSLVAQLKK